MKSSAIVWIGVGAALVASLLLAPLVTLGWCGDSPTPEDTSCGSAQLSLVGIGTSVWIWLGAVVLIAVITAAAARRARRRTT